MKSELVRQLLSLTLASSLGIITALALRRLMRRMFGARASYSLWLLVPLAMISVLLPHMHAAASSAAIAALPATTFPLTYALHRSFDSLAAASATPIDAARCTLGGWGAGAAMFALYLVALQRAFVKSLGPLTGSRCVLRAEHSVGCPALIGVIRPKVILPADFRSRYTRRERLLVLAHERTHLRRGDAGCNALLALMRCIFWFNPLMHVAARSFRFDQELACDAAVLVARRGARRSYANAMLKTHLTEDPLPIGCHWRSAQDLKERMRMVSRTAPNRRRRLIGGALTMLIAGVVAYTTWAAEPVAGDTTTPATNASTAGRSVMGWTAAWAGWVTSPDQAPDRMVVIAMRSAELFLTSGVMLEANADMVRSADLHVQGRIRVMGNTLSDEQGHPQTITLEGHVHLTFTSAAGSTSPQTIIVDANKAVLAGQPDGTTVVQVDEATMQTVMPPQFVYSGKPQILSQLLTPNSITPNFKDADISQVVAAVSVATHRTFVIDPRVHGLLTMVSTTPMLPEAFEQAFLEILRTRGFVAIPVGPAANATRILPGTSGPSPAPGGRRDFSSGFHPESMGGSVTH
ncbi:MAG TPA: M56 family metallopeptidase [Steroidobacteraceae bacterium]